MKQGQMITELAQQLQHIKNSAKDYVVPAARLADSLKADADGGTMTLTVQNGERHEFTPTSWAHSQLAEYADIPNAYYRRLLAQNPELLADNVNNGMRVAVHSAKDKNSGRILRTIDGHLRGFVSSRFRRLDNFDLFEAVAPSLIKLGFEPESTALTDRRLYIKVVSTKVEAEVKRGDVVRYGLVVSNSDVGSGSVRVEPLLYRLACLNGLITQTAIRQAHLGRNMAGDEIEHLLTDETKAKTDAAFWAQIRDVVENYAKPEFFEAEVNRLRVAADTPIKFFDLPEIVERTAKQIGITINTGVKESIIDNLASGAHGAGLNKWGLANAFTFGAQHESLDYDAATELERAGNAVLELTGRSWEAVNAK